MKIQNEAYHYLDKTIQQYADRELYGFAPVSYTHLDVYKRQKYFLLIRIQKKIQHSIKKFVLGKNI